MVVEIADSICRNIDHSKAVEIVQPSRWSRFDDFLIPRLKQDRLLFSHPLGDDGTAGQPVGLLQCLNVFIGKVVPHDMLDMHSMLAQPPHPAYQFAMGKNSLKF